MCDYSITESEWTGFTWIQNAVHILEWPLESPGMSVKIYIVDGPYFQSFMQYAQSGAWEALILPSFCVDLMLLGT